MTATPNNEAVGVNRKDGRPGIDRLWDSQWVNIVNSPEVLEALRNCEYEDAVNIAVRMTEQRMAANFATLTPSPAPGGGDAVAEVREEFGGGRYLRWASIDFAPAGTKLYTAPPASVPVSVTDDMVHQVQDTMALHGFPVPVRVISDALVTYFTALAQEHGK